MLSNVYIQEGPPVLPFFQDSVDKPLQERYKLFRILMRQQVRGFEMSVASAGHMHLGVDR